MLLEDEKIDLLFVTETDTRAITSEKDYSIKGFKTILQKRSSINDNVRIICLVRTNFEESITILDQIMTTEIPTIWLELKEANQRKTAIGGFYREWTHEGTKTVEEQLKEQ